MPDYLTHGTVQFIKKTTDASAPLNARVQIAPTNDYIIKHKNKRYVVFIDDHSPPNPPNPPNPHNLLPTRGFNVEDTFTFLDGLGELLKEAAFKRIPLEITIDDANQIIGITIPATP
jgi:hypothetical protein